MFGNLARSCLLWGSLTVESEGWLHRLQGAPAEDWAALLTGHQSMALVATPCSYRLSSCSYTEYMVHKHNAVLFLLNKGTSGEHVHLEQGGRHTSGIYLEVDKK